jgi:hypothetical protein
MIQGTSIGHGTLLERTSKFQSKSIGLCESKYYKPRFDEECLKLAG